MNRRPTLSNMLLDVWLLETILKAGDKGITLEQLQRQWLDCPNHEGELPRTTFNRHRDALKDMFEVEIKCSRNHYYISNPEVIALDTLANDLLASMHEYLFLDEYRDLGDAIQPQQIWAGMKYLHPIGDAIRYHKKMRLVYQKFTETEAEESVIHPYCLKADRGRWYVLAVKEPHGTTLEPSEVIGTTLKQFRTFALDRALDLVLLDETFKPDKAINPKTYFENAFGIWVDEEHYPVRDIVVSVPGWVAKYWRTLPLHHSQKEIEEYRDTDMPRFSFHISPSPDFLSELKKWDGEIV